MNRRRLSPIPTTAILAAVAAFGILVAAPSCRNDEPRPPEGGREPGGRMPGVSSRGPEWEERRHERDRMVDFQIEARGIGDPRVLSAMRTVPRHFFVPMQHQADAYADHPLPIGEGQTISQPYIVALMTELLQLKGTEKVLEIGTGSGYQAAILAEVLGAGASDPGGSVFTIEIVEPLAMRAARVLADMGYENIDCRHGDGYAGWPGEAPFDAIIVTAAPDHVPQPLIDQLADGGRLVLPLGDFYQELLRITRRGDAIERERITAVRFVPMTGAARDR